MEHLGVFRDASSRLSDLLPQLHSMFLGGNAVILLFSYKCEMEFFRWIVVPVTGFI